MPPCWALITLVRAKLNKPARAVAGGAIVRAENRRLMELLNPPIEFVEHVELSSFPEFNDYFVAEMDFPEENLWE